MHLFIDTETTGLPEGGVQPRIVSIAWVIADSPDRHELMRYMIVKPRGFRIPVEATNKHGISTEQATKEGVSLKQALDSLNDDVRTHKPDSVIAHNLSFDRPVVDAEYQRLGRASALSRLRGSCTLLLSQRKWPGQPASLNGVYHRLFGKGRALQHNARADVLDCREVYFALLGASGGATAEDLDHEMQEVSDLIDRILEWAEDHSWFDTGFVESCQSQLEERGRLTARQIEGLENIARRFNI
jgi:DNA polymerase III epsilon subunit-like protein